jgi:hypothetical protein
MATKKKVEKTEEVKEIEKDLDKALALDVLAKSQGGKLLMRGCLIDVVGDVDALSMGYMTLTMQQFVGLCADMKRAMDTYRALSRAPKNRAALQEMLKEAIGVSDAEEEGE